MASSRFVRLVVLRLCTLFATLCVLAYLVVGTSLHVTTVLVAIAAIAQSWQLVRFVARTNRELGRMLDAIRFDDVQQSFAIRELGPSFSDLGDALASVIARFGDARLEREAQRRYFEALVEHVPVAILAVHDDATVEVVNSAARRMLDTPRTIATDKLLAYGASFQRDVVHAATGTRLGRIELDGTLRHIIISTTQLAVAGATIRLVTLQDIQTELDVNELAAWQDMARILSHEILNSLTPISSLARTLDGMVDDLARPADSAKRDDLVADIHDAIQTLARRSETLMRFVHAYRQVTQMPPPTLRRFELDNYLPHLARLFTVELGQHGIELHVGAVPAGVAIVADDALLDQAIINVLRNAADAAAATTHPQVWLDAKLSERGRPVIEIADNGPGVDAAHIDQIFLPFFTTKREGSGIGLALARQVMLIHKGAITAAPRPGGGALFRLTF